MKELEALELIDSYIKLDEYDMETSGVAEAIRLLKKALTPPTSDEVCKALSEYLDRQVLKDVDDNFYYSEHRQIGVVDEIVCGYGWEHEHKTITFEFDLPPHLITLIGRFYQGVKE